MIRLLQKNDLKEIYEIYTYYVLHSSATFDYVPSSFTQFQQHMLDIYAFYPFLIYQQDHQVIAYAYISKLKDKQAYIYSGEVTIYIHPDYIHQKIGTRLLQALIFYADHMHILNLYACITSENTSSIHLCEKNGFKEVGRFQQCGYKFDRYLSVIWMERQNNMYVEKPLQVMNCKDVKDINLSIF